LVWDAKPTLAAEIGTAKVPGNSKPTQQTYHKPGGKMHLSQLTAGGVIVRQNGECRMVPGATTILALAGDAIAAGSGLAEVVAGHGQGDLVDLEALLAAGSTVRCVTPIRRTCI